VSKHDGISKIIKRDGRIVDFDKNKITEAIWKAIRSVGGQDRGLAERLSNQVVERLEKHLKPGEVPHVEQVQDLVEQVLVENNLYNVAKSYILYRALHAQIREFVDSYLENKSWLVKENANTTYSLQALNFHISSQVISQYWLHRIFNKGRAEIREAHLNGDFHIHNLGILGPYCVGWDLRDLLMTGFKGVRGKISAKPAKHFRVALGHVVNFVFTLQGEAAGAQAFSNFDTYLAPFIRYDGLDYKSVKQALQEFMFNMNIPTRVGFQSLCWDEPIIIREKGKVKVVEIGKLVDREFEKHPNRVIEQHPQSYALENHDDYEVLSFNPVGKAVWTRVKAFVRHKVPKNSEFVKIKTDRGEASVSKAHSLFSFSNFNGEFNPVPRSAENVKIADDYRCLNEENHFIALRSLDNQGDKEDIDLVEIIDEFPNLQKNVFVKINPTHTLNKIRQRVVLEEQSLVPFYKEFGIKDRSVWKSWLKSKSIRYDIWRKYGELDEKAEFRLKNSNAWYPRFLKGKMLENFVKLCAWYVSEGHASISTPFYVSQSSSGKARDIVALLKDLNALGRVTRSKGCSSKGGKAKTVLKITGKGLLAEIISRTCGYSSLNKVVPWFIFDLSPRYQRMFIETVLKDGSEYKNHWDYSTASKKLSAGLCLLLSQNGFRFDVYAERNSRNDKNRQDRFIIRIFKENSKPEKTYFINDFEARACLGVEKFKYDREYEYDISVELPQENFIGGAGLLVFHNTPFSNITLDLKVPRFMEDEPVTIGGETLDATYSDFQEEMNIFNRALAEVMLEGDAVERVLTFPIPTINITKDFDWNDDTIRKVFETSAKYGIPYFANFVNSDMNPEDVRSMCCHLRLDKRELKKRGGGLFGANPLTGSIGVVTINMPRIGYLSKSEGDFFERLDRLMVLAKDVLEIKRRWLERFTEAGLYPYSKFYLRHIKEAFGSYWKNHFSTIGLIGMNEACLNFLGCSIGSPEGLGFSIKVLDFMRKRLQDFQEETGSIFNLEATPAEGTSHRLARIDKKIYPGIIVANEEDVKNGAAPYYTNSTHLPVYYTDDLWEYLRLQDPLQVRYTGGTVVHVWLGESNPPVDSVTVLVRKICENFKLPYFTLTPTFSICPEDGYLSGEQPVCPRCGRNTEVYSRVVGYLRPVDQWNAGKQEEFKQRKVFDSAISKRIVETVR